MSWHRLFSECMGRYSHPEQPRFEIQIIDRANGGETDSCSIEELYQAFKERLLEEMQE